MGLCSISCKLCMSLLLRKQFEEPVVMGSSDIMKKKAHGSTEKAVQENLMWEVDRKKADKICSFNRLYAEDAGYFLKTTWLKEISEKKEEPKQYFDSVSGNLLFTAPVNRSFENFLEESKKHGWPSFRDDEVNWEYVRVLKGGEVVSLSGTHLGHNLPDKQGNRYCINLISIAGSPEVKQKTYQLQKTFDECTGLFWRSNPTEKQASVLSEAANWPLDNAFVQGLEQDVSGKKWLKVVSVQQPGQEAFTPVEGDYWLPLAHEQYFLKEQIAAS